MSKEYKSHMVARAHTVEGPERQKLRTEKGIKIEERKEKKKETKALKAKTAPDKSKKPMVYYVSGKASHMQKFYKIRTRMVGGTTKWWVDSTKANLVEEKFVAISPKSMQ
ncbi:hypothetical protein AMTR_s00020p00211170 [Amborella trichopoda]|uniref:Uncharacterized protein n=1 Tax=Amborella trichopoda TaxID=13333 RepID=W1PPF0_AMBTC|nr:hypothetical protein AMTR_s00020p00211170 [Amborella trichopoda]